MKGDPKMPSPGTTECPFCHGQIREKALKCKHCESLFLPDNHLHGGVCPFCKEDIHPEAIRCLHCKSALYSIPVATRLMHAIDLEKIVFGED
jgi:hypothetical protein